MRYSPAGFGLRRLLVPTTASVRALRDRHSQELCRRRQAPVARGCRHRWTGYEPGRVELRDREAAHQGDQGRRLEGHRAGEGYKLLITAQERWRRFNGHELITAVLDGATFKDGVKVTDDEVTTPDEKVAA